MGRSSLLYCAFSLFGGRGLEKTQPEETYNLIWGSDGMACKHLDGNALSARRLPVGKTR